MELGKKGHPWCASNIVTCSVRDALGVPHSVEARNAAHANNHDTGKQQAHS
jgi:hypothetical protein